MAESHQVTALVAKHTELAGLLDHHRNGIARIRGDVRNLDTTIKISAPEVDLLVVVRAKEHWSEIATLGRASHPRRHGNGPPASRQGLPNLPQRGKSNLPTRLRLRFVVSFPAEIHKVIYTTNAIEILHMQLQKIIKSRANFPGDEAATKLLWLALRNITADWGRAAKEWTAPMNQFG